MYYKRAIEIWCNLEERLGKTSFGQLYYIQEELFNAHRNQVSIGQFYTKMKALWDVIDDVSPSQTCTCVKCTCGLVERVSKEIQDYRLLHFLMKVNE